MKIGIFGGSFDPPHIAHTLSCLYVFEVTDIEQICVVPCHKHPFDKPTVDFSYRVEMCKLAMRKLGDKVVISEIEREREGISYTIDTIRTLKQRTPEHTFTLIVGSDILAQTDKWKEFDEIKRTVEIFELPRPLEDKSASAREFFMPKISSSMIRKRLKSGQDVSQFLSTDVISFINSKQLYI